MRRFIFPLIFYFLFFVLLTYPAILAFPDKLWADGFDGLQNVWNIWWVNKAITEIHKSIWFTQMLHFPAGTSLIGHTLNPLNGIMGIFFLKFMSLTQTYNFILIFAFAASGFFAYLLAFYLTRNFWGSLFSGFIYTFSNFHFAHAQGHLQTVSMQWIPLFLLFWIRFLDKPKFIYALGSAVLLYFNVLSDYYFFLYCVSAGFIIYVYRVVHSKDILAGGGMRFIRLILIFTAVTLASSGEIIMALFRQNQSDPLWGAHPPAMFSADLLSIFIPGGHWKFAHLTESFWSRLPGNIHESSISIGVSVLIMVIYVFWRRRKLKDKFLNLWFLIFTVFLVLSMGPKLQILGMKINSIPMPYGFMEKILPFMSLSGMPIRMTVMVILSAAIIFAYGFKYLSGVSLKNNIILLVFISVLFIEYLPKNILQTALAVPAYISRLKLLPEGAVIDTVSSPTDSLYYQTIYDKPQAFGYIARTPRSVILNDYSTLALLQNGQYDILCRELKFRYLVASLPIKILGDYQVYQDDEAVIYDLCHFFRR